MIQTQKQRTWRGKSDAYLLRRIGQEKKNRLQSSGTEEGGLSRPREEGRKKHDTQRRKKNGAGLGESRGNANRLVY